MYNCLYCEKEAVVNYQRLWVKYPIIPGKGGEDCDFGPPQIMDWAPANDDNRFLCQEHLKLFEEGSI